MRCVVRGTVFKFGFTLYSTLLSALSVELFREFFSVILFVRSSNLGRAPKSTDTIFSIAQILLIGLLLFRESCIANANSFGNHRGDNSPDVRNVGILTFYFAS